VKRIHPREFGGREKGVGAFSQLIALSSIFPGQNTMSAHCHTQLFNYSTDSDFLLAILFQLGHTVGFGAHNCRGQFTGLKKRVGYLLPRALINC
jgi:hypothetical protein